jgi:glutamine amidotransferase-like uncharacterized protein
MSKPKYNILIYVENPMCSIDCADGLRDVLESSPSYQVTLVGPGSIPKQDLNSDIMRKADCVVMPGGTGDASRFKKSKLKNIKEELQEYISEGGKYLGICMGAYFADKRYFDILSKSTRAVQYAKRTGSTIKHEKHAIVTLDWEHEEKNIYFHDGTAFVPSLFHSKINGDVVAKYKNGDAAALIQTYGKGKVGVIGPHPEAQKWWFYVQPKIKTRWLDCIQHKLVINFLKKMLH